MLTKRLEYLINALPECNVLADVGCDHGYVGIEALKRGKAKQTVFIDISPACLQKARSGCPAAFSDVAKFVCQDGLRQIDCDTAVICGMGGLEIMSILNNAKRLPATVVLQPMRNIVDVRKYVAERYTITLDATVCDGKFYSVIVGQNVGTPTRKMSELETYFGITNVANPTDDYIGFLLLEQSKLKQIETKQKQFKRDGNLDELNFRKSIVEQALASALSK